MTSNIGSAYLLEGQFDSEDYAAADLVMAELRRHFKPALLNRRDAILIFHSFTGTAFRLLARKRLGDRVKRWNEQ